MPSAAGENRLVVEQAGKVSDDIRVGEITLDSRPPSEALSEATVELTVRDADHPGALLPCRITVLDAGRRVGGPRHDVRRRPRGAPRRRSTSRRQAPLPASRRRVPRHRRRGFANSIDAITLKLRPGEHARKTLTIRREVLIPGFVACDTHVHTLTYSGHGDASVDEQVLAIAGEGVELPIAADHNPGRPGTARRRQAGPPFFTPVVGNEVTTAVGHFNIWPARAEGRSPTSR